MKTKNDIIKALDSIILELSETRVELECTNLLDSKLRLATKVRSLERGFDAYWLTICALRERSKEL